MAKKKKVDRPIPIMVMGTALFVGERKSERLVRILQNEKTDHPLAAKAEEDLVEILAERKRIKEINKYVDGRTLVEMRLRGGPMATLINGHKIGGEEFRAIMDIELAFMAISGGMMIKAVSLELKSPGKKPEWSSKTSDAVQRFQIFANFWSARRTFGDRTMEILLAAVVEGRAFRVIEEEVGLRHGNASKIAVRGLRDYAARARWVDHAIARKWMDDALLSYRGNDPLALAIAKAQALRFEESGAS